MEGKSVNFLQNVIKQLKREKELLLGIVKEYSDCEFCVHGGDLLPCVKNGEYEDMMCEECKRECVCKECGSGECFEWNGKGVEDES